jgi:hypothetical protein
MEAYMLKVSVHLITVLVVLALNLVHQPPMDNPTQETIPSAVSSGPASSRTARDNVTEMTPVLYVPAFFRPNYVNPFGVVMYEGANDANGLTKMAQAGAHWATVPLYWKFTEPTAPVNGQHTYQWHVFDASALNAKNAGVSLMAMFTSNPGWAAQYPGGPVTNTTHLVSFVTAMAERYDGDGNADAPGQPIVNYWMFYGEPDNHEPWRSTQQGKGVWGNNPQGYAAMLAQVASAIHAANPNAKVSIGGIAYDWFTTDPTPGPFVRSFLGNVLQHLNTYPGGVTRYLDAVAFHYYPISTARWPSFREKALEIKGIMNQHGAGGLELLVPEMGFWSAGGQYGSSEARQAQVLVQMYVKGLSVGVHQMAWYRVFDYGEGTETTGLFRNQNLLEPKPAYTAYDVLTTELANALYLGPLTVTGVEGYVFSVPPGASTKTVLWATGLVPRNVTFNHTCARRVDYLGNAIIVHDGQAGDVDGANGRVTLSVPVNSPIYVGACP